MLPSIKITKKGTFTFKNRNYIELTRNASKRSISEIDLEDSFQFLIGIPVIVEGVEKDMLLICNLN